MSYEEDEDLGEPLFDDFIIDEDINAQLPERPKSLREYTQYLGQFYDYIWGKIPAPATGRNFALSHTSISRICNTPLDFYKYVVDSKFCKRDAGTDAMSVGSIVDDLVLLKFCNPMEYEKAGANILPMGAGFTRNGAANKLAYQKEVERIQAGNPKRQVVSPSIWHKGEQAAYALIGEYKDPTDGKYKAWNPAAYKLIDNNVYTKYWFDYFDKELGQQIAGEIDLIGKDPRTGQYYLADIKSMDKTDPKSVGYRIRDRLLPLQAAIYQRAVLAKLGIEVEDFYFIATNPDGNSYIYKLGYSEWKYGKELLQKGLSRFASCAMSGASAFIASHEEGE